MSGNINVHENMSVNELLGCGGSAVLELDCHSRERGLNTHDVSDNEYL